MTTDQAITTLVNARDGNPVTVIHPPVEIRTGYSLPGVEFSVNFNGQFHVMSKAIKAVFGKRERNKQ
jgi:hypothetical protein